MTAALHAARAHHYFSITSFIDEETRKPDNALWGPGGGGIKQQTAFFCLVKNQLLETCI
jgi:hypothetical protein